MKYKMQKNVGKDELQTSWMKQLQLSHWTKEACLVLCKGLALLKQRHNEYLYPQNTLGMHTTLPVILVSDQDLRKVVC